MNVRVPTGFFEDSYKVNTSFDLSHFVVAQRHKDQRVRPYGYSSETGDLLPKPEDSFSVIPASWFGDLFKKPAPPMTLAGLANVLTGIESIDVSDAFSLLCSRATLIPEESLQNAVDIFYERARRDDGVCSWTVETPRYRFPDTYCRDECAFLCGKIGKGIASKFPDVKVFSVNMGSSNGVYAFVGDSKRRTSYGYHVALALVDKEGRVGMIDPVVYERASVVSFEDWWGRFDHTKGGYGFRVLQFANETA